MRTTVISLAALILLALAMTGSGRPDPSQTGFLLRSVTVAGQEFKYAVYIPRHYTAAAPSPAVLFLHGSGECGTDGQKQLAVGLAPAIMKFQDRWLCIAIFPQKPDQQKQWEDYDAALMAMLDATRKEWNIDPDRLALTGLSQGGHGTWAVGALHADKFSALVPICGYMWGGDPAKTAAAIKTIPEWVFHGEADTTVKVEESHHMIDALKAADGEAKLTTYPGVGHESWDRAYAEPELPVWLLAKKRAAAHK